MDRFISRPTSLLIGAILFCIGFGDGNAQEPPPTTSELNAMVDGMAVRFDWPRMERRELTTNAERREVALLHAWLANTYEVAIHQIGGETENKVYLSKDGHQEAVYDEQGLLITEPPNEGSYNFAPAELDPLGHFSVDIFAWIELGSSPDDPTTKPIRLVAYFQDLRDGLHRAASEPIPELPEGLQLTEVGRDIPIKLFRRALARSGQSLGDVLPADDEGAASLDAWFDKFAQGLNYELVNTLQLDDLDDAGPRDGP